MKARSDRKFLDDAIAAYRAGAEDPLDQAADAVLERLSGDERAAAAFAAFKLDGNAARWIVDTCIQADELRRNFEKHTAAARTDLRKGGRLDRLEKDVAEPSSFAGELFRPTTDRLSCRSTYDPSYIREVKRGLAHLADAIETRRLVLGKPFCAWAPRARSTTPERPPKLPRSDGWRRACAAVAAVPSSKPPPTWPRCCSAAKSRWAAFARPCELASANGACSERVRSGVKKRANEPYG